MAETTVMTAPAAGKPAQPATPAEVIELTLMKGDFSKLTPELRLDYIKKLCDDLGLTFSTRPFDFFTDKKSGKMTLYATKNCTDQLRKLHAVSLDVVARDVVFDDCLMVTVEATVTLPNKAKRHDKDVGVVCIAGLKGDDKANALMRAVTKAKRRVTLSICGLGGVPDESELEDVPGVQLPRSVEVTAAAPAALPAPTPPPGCEGAPGMPANASLPVLQAQLSEVVSLKAQLGLTGEPWQALVAKWGRRPSEMTQSQAFDVLAELRHLVSARQLEAGMVGADGLPLAAPQAAHVNGTGAPPAGTFRR
jgi:hypothetical protein